MVSQFVNYENPISAGNPDQECFVYRSDSGKLAVIALAGRTDGIESSPTFAVFDNITLTRGELDEAKVPISVNFVFQLLPENLAAVTPAAGAGCGGIVQSKMGKVIERLRTYSASLYGNSTYIYMNYANPEQDVVGSYGAENAKFLKETAAKYDPAGFFQRCLMDGK
ncbi:FAD binding domain-containing protein [Colletotrichum tofieldiae]|nr:FAD binding domain-containing protein [Colletotrichum tofieldiae]GKT80776.1 FAD binding domain-containing protein [Colletotrichum tofieldiae]